MKRNKKGFTLAELLIVVAIIGVLVAVSIPIFTNQLEKARDATSIANMRSAYAEAMNYALQYDGSDWTVGGTADDNTKVWVDSSGIVSAVRIKIVVKSNKANDWSGLADKLPFQLTSNVSGKTITDDGQPSTPYRSWYIQFNFNSKHAGELQKVMIWHA